MDTAGWSSTAPRWPDRSARFAAGRPCKSGWSSTDRATSPLFDLSAAERDFAERHARHDADYAAMRLVNWLVTDVCGIPLPTTGGPVARNEYVLQCAAGHIPDDVSPVVAEILTRHAPAAARMNAFYWKLFGGDIHAEYPAGNDRSGR
ncbi:hypothetical protein [Nocardia sp. NPDC059239]|uniref:hypothetical protein n=1 Tax=unclassified Nocardia TaxID=2637762 RepID=UPI00369FFEED